SKGKFYKVEESGTSPKPERSPPRLFGRVVTFLTIPSKQNQTSFSWRTALVNRRLPTATFWDRTPDTLWYWDHRQKHLVGYATLTRRFIGSIGPDGFRAARRDLPGFTFVAYRVVGTPRSLYELDMQSRTLKPIFTASREDPIIAVNRASESAGDAPRLLVATRTELRLIDDSGRVAWTLEHRSEHRV